MSKCATVTLALIMLINMAMGIYIPKHESISIGMPVQHDLLKNFQQAGILEQEAEVVSEKVALVESAMVALDTKYHINMHQVEIEEQKKRPDWSMVQSYGELAQEIQDQKTQLMEDLKEYIREETTVTTGVLQKMIVLWQERAALSIVTHGNVLDWDLSGWIVRPIAGAFSQDNVKAYHGKENSAMSKTVDQENSNFYASAGAGSAFFGLIKTTKSQSGGSTTAHGSTDNKNKDSHTDLVTIRSKAHFKNALVLTPVFHKTQAIPVWNQMFPEDRFGAMGAVPEQLYAVRKAGNSGATVTLVTGARYMAQFYGTVHVTKNEEQCESQLMDSTIEKMESAIKVDILMISVEHGHGHENSRAQQLANSLSKTAVTVQYFAHTFGILVELQTDVMNTVLKKQKQDAAESAKQVAASRKSAKQVTDSAIADATETDRKNKKERGIVDVTARLTMEQEQHALEITGAGALMHAFKMFKARVAAADEMVGQLEGAPYQYAVTSYGKADIADIMLVEYHQGWLNENADKLI